VIRQFVAVTLVFVTTFTSLSYATDVSGDVWGEWTAAGNPYNVVGDLRVPPGSTLVIGPGCYIEFQGYYRFVVDSSALFQAIGSESDSVIFSSSDSLSGWDGFRFLYAAFGTEFSYCRIEYAHGHGINDAGGIQCQYSYYVLRNSSIIKNLNTSVISLREYNNAVIDNNSFLSNHGGAVIFSIRNSILEISENIFAENDSTTIISAGLEHGLLIRDNLFYENNNSCIIFDGGSGTIVERNIIHHNLCTVFYGFDISQSILRRNIIYNNHCPWQLCGSIFTSEDGDFIVENNTICNNSGGSPSYMGWLADGGHGTSGPILFKNNIIWGNTYNNPESSLFMLGDIIFTQTYSDVQGGWSGIGNITIDPMFVDTGGGDFHLMPGSPCIDTGDPASPLDPDSTRADMGALYFDQTTGIDLPPMLPREIVLYQNYPNPFNAGTKILFSIYDESDVTINIFDMLGRRVCSLLDNQLQAGDYTVNWDGRSDSGERMSSGVYFYNLKTDGFEDSRKMVILK